MELIETKVHIGENKISIGDLYNNVRLIDKTGIEYVYGTNLSTSEFAAEACFKIDPISYRDIKLCIVVTQTPEDFLPANGIKIAEKR